MIVYMYVGPTTVDGYNIKTRFTVPHYNGIMQKNFYWSPDKGWQTGSLASYPVERNMKELQKSVSLLSKRVAAMSKLMNKVRWG